MRLWKVEADGRIQRRLGRESFSREVAGRMAQELRERGYSGVRLIPDRASHEDMPVYTASAWWRGSEPSMQVVARQAKVAEKKIKELMKEAAKEAYEDGSYDSFEEAEDALAWSGVHAFSLGDLAKGRELVEAASELEDLGYWYPPMP
jgi:hypothetical protein